MFYFLGVKDTLFSIFQGWIKVQKIKFLKDFERCLGKGYEQYFENLTIVMISALYLKSN